MQGLNSYFGNRVNQLQRTLLKRYGKGVFTLLNIFFASISVLLIFGLVNIIRTSTPEISKQLIVVSFLLLIMGDITNTFAFIKFETILSISFLQIYPISRQRHLELIYFYFLKHSRMIIYIFPASYIGYKLIVSPVSFMFFFVGSAVFYLTSTLIIAFFYHFLYLYNISIG